MNCTKKPNLSFHPSWRLSNHGGKRRERHKFAQLTMKKTVKKTLCTCFFHPCTFRPIQPFSSNPRPEMTRFEDECKHLSFYFCFLAAHITSRLFCFWAIELRSATDKGLQSTLIN